MAGIDELGDQLHNLSSSYLDQSVDGLDLQGAPRRGTVEGNVRDRARHGRNAIEQHFRTAIGDGAIRPGERLPPERVLCGVFDASRSTVRAALAALERDHLVEKRLGSGTYVMARQSTRSGSMFLVPVASPLDVIEARRVIEPGYAELVAARATEEDFERMRLGLSNWRRRRTRSHSRRQATSSSSKSREPAGTRFLWPCRR